MKEGGEEGRNAINKYTKLLTIVLALIEGIGLYLTYKSSGIFVKTDFLTGFLVVISLMAGTSLLMWLGDQITNKRYWKWYFYDYICRYHFWITKCSNYDLGLNIWNRSI